ncbi:phage tail tube protein, partial [Mesorhizobium sp.]|uniref:phage tail tube protein n=1 Tax=Mesorhizobium sp. TaxID=1871066 RepID=UPI001207284A
MSDANRVRLTHVREVTLGVTPNTPRMRTARMTGETLRFAPAFVSSEEIRDDRMNADPIKVDEMNDGPVNGELSWPPHASPFSDWLESLFCNVWSNAPYRDNDGTADSVITAVATAGTQVTHLTGDAFVASQLVRFTGFGVAGNNGVFKCTTGGTTTSAYSGSGITDEAAPPAAARMKVVGFQGASGDITATSTGLGSTSLDFTTLGLKVGQWLKIGGTAAGDKFATAALNGWARIIAIAANALTLDNLPTGWAT